MEGKGYRRREGRREKRGEGKREGRREGWRGMVEGRGKNMQCIIMLTLYSLPMTIASVLLNKQVTCPSTISIKDS